MKGYFGAFTAEIMGLDLMADVFMQEQRGVGGVPGRSDAFVLEETVSNNPSLA